MSRQIRTIQRQVPFNEVNAIPNWNKKATEKPPDPTYNWGACYNSSHKSSRNSQGCYDPNPTSQWSKTKPTIKKDIKNKLRYKLNKNEGKKKAQKMGLKSDLSTG